MTKKECEELKELLAGKRYEIRGDATHDEIIHNRTIQLCMGVIESYYESHRTNYGENILK